MVSRIKYVHEFSICDCRRYWVDTSAECFTDDLNIRTNRFPVAAEHPSSATQSRLDFISHKGNLIRRAKFPCRAQESWWRNNNTTFTLKWFYQETNRVLINRRFERFGVPVWDFHEARGERAESIFVLIFR